MVENFRDWKILILTLTLAPFFVVLMYYYLGTTPESYRVVFVNHDVGKMTEEGDFFNAGEIIITEAEEINHEDGSPILIVFREQTLQEAKNRIKNKSADLIIEIPENFTESLESFKAGNRDDPAVVRSWGDPANFNYMLGLSWCHYIVLQYGATVTGHSNPVEFLSEDMTQMKSLSDFELYVPALLGLAIMMLMFTASATVIKEKDKGTLIRLRISNMTTFEWLSAVSVAQLIIGLLAMGLTLLTAISLGYETSGSLWALTVIGLLSCLAIIAISLVVAAFMRTIFDLVTIGSFPFFILMFFSEGMFPISPVQIFMLGGRSIHINDILPTSHAIAAFKKIMNQGAGLDELVFEMGAIIGLTVFFFAAGIWFFTRRHMKAS